MKSKHVGILKRTGAVVRKIPAVGFIVWWIYMLLNAPKKIFLLSAEKDKLEQANNDLITKQNSLEQANNDLITKQNSLEQANNELNTLIKELNSKFKEVEYKSNEQNKIYDTQLAIFTDIITKECVELGKLKIKNPDLKPIFIHSIFRSGSTYLWNKFRSAGNYWSYHEPFHEVMLDLEIKDQKEIFGNPIEEHTKLLGHPPTDKHYFWEYFTINKKVPAFRKEFIFDYFCTDTDDIHEDMENYIYFLIGYAHKRSVFKFTRSSMRSRWLKKHFDSVNIYLLRNSRSQFESYQNHFRNGNLYFHTMSLITIGKNQRKYSLFSEISKKYGIPYYDSDNFNDERMFYSNEVLPKLNTKDLYVLFYSIWLSSLIENFYTNDIFFFIDTVSSSQIEKQKIMEEFKKVNIDLDLSDCRIEQYQSLSLSNVEFEESENMVYDLVKRLNIYDKEHLEKVDEYIKYEVLGTSRVI